MYRFPTIYLAKGGTSVVKVDLTKFELSGGNLVFTMQKKETEEIIKEVSYSTSEEHTLFFECDFTKDLELGEDIYEYDFFLHIDGERFQQCLPSPIVVEENVGGKR